MKIVCKTERVIVFDEVLSPEQLGSIWHYFQHAPVRQVNTAHKAWTVTDGQPYLGTTPILAGKDLNLNSVTQKALKFDRFSKYPSNTPLDAIINIILQHNEMFAAWIGKIKTDWHYFSANPCIYPQGTALSWHTDSQYGGKTGAYTFYIHPEWKANWGGELLVSDAEVDRLSNAQFDRDRDNGLEKDGIFVTPRPNRLAIISGGTLHKIARVEPAAGNNVRASVTGFFYKTQPVPQL